MIRLPGLLPADIPVLETERLIIRGAREDDFPGFLAMWGDERVTTYIGGRPRPSDEVWRNLLRGIGSWAMYGFGGWVIADKRNDQFIGDVGLMVSRRDAQPALPDLPEVGWALSADYHGGGYASEAVSATLHWADANLNSPLHCIIDPDNAPSLRLAYKMDFRQKGVSQLGDTEVCFLIREADGKLTP